MTRLKYVATLRAGGTPTVDDPNLWDDSGLPWVSISDMSAVNVVENAGRSVSPLGIASKGLPIGKPGTVLFAMYASVGATATLGISATWNQALVGITPHRGKADSRFVRYWLDHFNSELGALYRSNTQNNLNAEQVANLPFPEIDVRDQKRIADFLDAETSRLDALSRARVRQRDLLDERHDSWWSTTVAALFESSAVVPLRRVLRSIVDGPFGSSLTSSHYSNDGSRVIRLGNVGRCEFRDSDRAYIPPEYARALAAHAIKAGDLVVAGLGDETWPLGRAAVVPRHVGPAIVKADCYRLRLEPSYDHEFAAWVLSSRIVGARIKLLARGSTRSRLNTQVVRDVEIPLVERPDQMKIMAEFRERSSANDQATERLDRSLVLLAERRQALVTAAVTGEVDVTT